ncbi:GntR family transcriptional regulator [Streptomyces sparsogenes]|uniref:GntR family transcriptional regulator n=1 Tax=Streptomyces sparsogenes TaxID=67365 RepID=UPI0033D33FE2
MPETTGYAEIAAYYRRQIQDGELSPGDTMPSLNAVCERWGVATTTANRAYQQLKREGLTRARPGVGTVVASPASDNISSRVRTYAATGAALSNGETSKIIAVGTVGADAVVAPRLDVAQGTPVHMRQRLVSRGGVPVHVSSSYYPAYVMEVTPELGEMVSTGGSRELAAQRLGVDQDHVLEEITSRHATEPEKDMLNLTAGNVVVTQVVRTVFLSDGRVVEVAVKTVGGATPLRFSSSLRENRE